MDATKQALVAHCRFILDRKLEVLSFAIDEIKIAMENETKSSAGDKHETARARMQAEQERLEKQLQELRNQSIEFERTIFFENNTEVKSGSLVETNHGLFLICIALGKIELEGKTLNVISAASPLGSRMSGIKRGQRFEFYALKYEVISVS